MHTSIAVRATVPVVLVGGTLAAICLVYAAMTSRAPLTPSAHAFEVQASPEQLVPSLAEATAHERTPYATITVGRCTYLIELDLRIVYRGNRRCRNADERIDLDVPRARLVNVRVREDVRYNGTVWVVHEDAFSFWLRRGERYGLELGYVYNEATLGVDIMVDNPSFPGHHIGL